jgi:ornithine cyclodeaminase/alanine dehydrogenase
MRPGALAIVTDAAKPWQRDSFDAFGTVVVDDRVQELSMPDPVVSAERLAGDLTDLVAGKVQPGPGPRAFMFRGIAAGDYALAARVWETVQRQSA